MYLVIAHHLYLSSNELLLLSLVWNRILTQIMRRIDEQRAI